MSKATRVQRPLFGPWLAWEQLPDSVREQALDVLTAICLEITDDSRIGDQTTLITQPPRALDLDPRDLPRMESESDDTHTH
jgi:hypothetical protein